MRTQRDVQILKRGGQKSGQQHEHHSEFCLRRWLVSPVLNFAKALRRRILLSRLLKHAR
jgi:hypothetical protein